jgi:hypothetical protein
MTLAAITGHDISPMYITAVVGLGATMVTKPGA